MKYFYDTEFLDNGKTIELISIGIVAEDGREYHAVSQAAPWFEVHTHPWLKTNVVPFLPPESEWKDPARIRREVHEFLMHDFSQHNMPEMWAWFAAYDHVVLAQLFGRMIDMPPGIPQFTHDVRSLAAWAGVKSLPKQEGRAHDALEDARHVKVMYDHIEARRKRPVDESELSAVLAKVKQVAADYEAVPHHDENITESTEESYDRGFAIGYNGALDTVKEALKDL